jgi:endonuclease YncB( thermonuclease family)
MAQEQRSVGAAALAIALLAASPAHGRQCERATLAGAVTHVRDGDTIEVGAGDPVERPGRTGRR